MLLCMSDVTLPVLCAAQCLPEVRVLAFVVGCVRMMVSMWWVRLPVCYRVVSPTAAKEVVGLGINGSGK